MPAGVEVINDWGRVQVTSDAHTMVLHSKGYVSTVAVGAYQYSASKAVFSSTSLPPKGVFAFSCGSRLTPMQSRYNQSPRSWGEEAKFEMACAGGVGTTVEWFYFVPINQISSNSTSGFQLFREDGTLAYDAAHKPIKFVDHIQMESYTGTQKEGTGIASRTYDAGHSFAAIYSGGWLRGHDDKQRNQTPYHAWDDFYGVGCAISGSNVSFGSQRCCRHPAPAGWSQPWDWSIYFGGDNSFYRWWINWRITIIDVTGL